LKDTSEQLTMLSGHLVHEIRVDWAAPMLFMAICAAFLILIQNLYGSKLMEWGFSLQEHEIDVDEGIPNFFKAIKLI